MILNSPRHWLIGIVSAVLFASGCAQSIHRTAQAPVTIAGSQPASQAVLDRKALSDFRQGINRYMKLHAKVQRQGTRQKSRADVGENEVSTRELATRIRRARHDARPGEIFTPAVAKTLRAAMNPELRGAAAAGTRRSIAEDAPVAFVLAVNADYPDGASRSTMPGNVLNILPSLPNDLEYRIVATHLVLMDVDANIVVDYLLDVM